MLSLIGLLVVCCWLSLPEDEPVADTDSWSALLSARNWTAAAERLK